MAGSLGRLVVGALALGGFVSFAACSAPPETAQSSDEAFSLAPPPRCFSPPVWAQPTVNAKNCVVENLEISNWRSFENTPFENALVARGCSYALAGDPNTYGAVRAFGTTTGPNGSEGWNLTVCPSSCALDNLLTSFTLSKNPDGTPVDPHVATVRPSNCVDPIPSDDVYVLWDPKCPGGCPVLGNGI